MASTANNAPRRRLSILSFSLFDPSHSLSELELRELSTTDWNRLPPVLASPPARGPSLSPSWNLLRTSVNRWVQA
ncbi:unnamed protein product [Prunus armeniaca]|uniref:Uncharacterized protein n=1 Tax=Prunus armeniaca TaxID=36596 RepID=A0A6J5TKI3_PRUAR|nr:unnamed protein product [Prunus armeniaca]